MDQLPVEILSALFKFLRQIDLIKASSACKLWHSIIQTESFCSKLKETDGLFYHRLKETDGLFYHRQWLIKTYFRHFERFGATVYWECVGALPIEVFSKVENGILERMFHSVLPYRVWYHFWSYIRSQFNTRICQFCTKLQIKTVKINRYIF